MAETRSRHRSLGIAALAILLLIRWLTLAPDPWEWDEILFTQGVAHGIDVRVNHPHPPGNPAFIEIGRLLHFTGLPAFEATRLAGAAGGLASVAGLVFLLWTLGLRKRWSLYGGLLYSFLPSVWLHGVRPLSDGPGAAAFLFAAGALVRSIREADGGRYLVLAALLSALAAGVRPQLGLALLPTAVLAAGLVARRRGRAGVLAAALAAVVGLGVSVAVWLPAISGSGGLASYLDAFRLQMEWVSEHDSPSLRAAAGTAFWTRWFVDPLGGWLLAVPFYVLALSGIALDPRRSGALLAIFAPAFFITLGVLAQQSAPRYALATLPLPCGLVAAALCRLHDRRGLVAIAAVLLLCAFAGVALRPVVTVATHQSPSVAAMKALRDDPELRGRPVFHAGTLKVHAEVFLPPGLATEIPKGRAFSLPKDGLLVVADARPLGLTPVRRYAYGVDSLSVVSRGRYLETTIFDARRGAAGFLPRVSGPGAFSYPKGEARLSTGASLRVFAARGPVDVHAIALMEAGTARLRVESSSGVRILVLTPGRHSLDLVASPAAGEKLFEITVEDGAVVLSEWSLSERGR